ncbi:cellulose biosynthesis protein BcsO [Kosakonia sp. SMBL-WEM22]|uniref:cellulose biosynthesis protein BcsO n=1 Tax=Kosakonia sp. SMBL-WEM22 TaxID=2725560 RepID=UPI001658D26B|nr:cellulose biosynthesis protein BcsO [Kosakonia sp. SMBL-WEM22]QNQ18463.1 cellulose biosynthesis protein BcsO [Kosakonia sp. SMBL-WEM22]
MKYYDDLQRFREKSGKQHHAFKDLSTQSPTAGQGNWAILNQLAPADENAGLALGGHVASPVPHPIDSECFAYEARISTPPTPSASQSENIPAQRAAPPSQRDVSIHYDQLFAARPAQNKPRSQKNQPLQPLLERIAACR